MNPSEIVQISTVPVENFAEVGQDGELQVFVGGVDGKFLDMVLKHLNWIYNVSKPSDGEWGRKTNTGSWTGMIGMVYNGSADMAINLIALSEQRLSEVNFTVPYGIERSTYGIFKPGQLPRTFAFVYPFSPLVWGLMLLSLLLMPLVLYLLLDTKLRYTDLLIQVFGNLFQQSMEFNMKPFKVKILVTAWLFGATIMSLSYSGLLLSFLTIPVQKPLVRNFQELSVGVDKGTHRCYGSNGNIHYEILKTSTQGYLSELGLTIKNNWFLNGLNKEQQFGIMSEENALLKSELTLLIEKAMNINLDLYVSDDYLSSFPVGIPLKKGFCCKKRLDSIIERSMRAGLRDKFIKEVMFKLRLEAAKNITVSDKSQPLSVPDIAGAIVMFIIGNMFALMVFFAELVCAYTLKRRGKAKEREFLIVRHKKLVVLEK